MSSDYKILILGINPAEINTHVYKNVYSGITHNRGKNWKQPKVCQ